MSHPVSVLPPFAWPVEPAVAIPVVITGAVYLRGWGRLRRRLTRRFEVRHAAVCLAGLMTLLLATASPVDALTHRWLSAHMVQHLLLMVVVPPMLWMGAPEVPLVVGLPRSVRRMVLAATKTPISRSLIRWLSHPTVRPSARRVVRVRARLLGLARACALRSRSRLRRLASRRARLLPRERAAVLATSDPGVAGAGDLAPLDDGSVSGPRDVPEPAAGRDPDVRRPRDLHQVFVRRRPGTRRRHHVGARIDPAPPA